MSSCVYWIACHNWDVSAYNQVVMLSHFTYWVKLLLQLYQASQLLLGYLLGNARNILLYQSTLLTVLVVSCNIKRTQTQMTSANISVRTYHASAMTHAVLSAKNTPLMVGDIGV